MVDIHYSLATDASLVTSAVTDRLRNTPSKTLGRLRCARGGQAALQRAARSKPTASTLHPNRIPGSLVTVASPLAEHCSGIEAVALWGVEASFAAEDIRRANDFCNFNTDRVRTSLFDNAAESVAAFGHTDSLTHLPRATFGNGHRVNKNGADQKQRDQYHQLHTLPLQLLESVPGTLTPNQDREEGSHDHRGDGTFILGTVGKGGGRLVPSRGDARPGVPPGAGSRQIRGF